MNCAPVSAPGSDAGPQGLGLQGRWRPAVISTTDDHLRPTREASAARTKRDRFRRLGNTAVIQPPGCLQAELDGPAWSHHKVGRRAASLDDCYGDVERLRNVKFQGWLPLLITRVNLIRGAAEVCPVQLNRTRRHDNRTRRRRGSPPQENGKLRTRVRRRRRRLPIDQARTRT